MKICSQCGHENDDSAKFCSSCGTELGEANASDTSDGRTCAQCGTAIDPEAKFCPSCGAEQVSEALRQKVLQADWKDIDLGTPARPAGRRNMMLLPILVVPALVAVIYLMTGRSNRAADEHVHTEQQQMSPEQMKRIAAQLDSLKNAIKTNPQDTTAMLVLGEMYEMAGKFPQARGYYLEFLGVAPKHYEVRMRVASTYFNEKKIDSAGVVLKEVLQDYPDDPLALYNYALTLHMAGDHEGAINTWKRVVELDKTGEVASQAQKAIDMLKSAPEMNGNN